MALAGKVLVLNRIYQPVRVVNVQRAICQVYKGSAKVLTFDWAEYSFSEWIEFSKSHGNGALIRSPEISIVIPDIILLSSFDKVPPSEIILTKTNLYARDANTCQYCGKPIKSTKERSVDHVIPRAKGGTTAWTNVVLSCKKCNLKKADRTPEEAGMMLIRRPGFPKLSQLLMEALPQEKKDSWRVFLK